jgi:valine dehydrogenase (NAD+)
MTELLQSTTTSGTTAVETPFSTDELGAHERIVHAHDERTGLRAIIAIHSTLLGPALGGTRFYPYADAGSALTDVLRLSRGMTLKAAVAGLDLGGGKAVIVGDPRRDKTPALLEAYGRLVESLHGTYITAGDVGTTSDDMDVIGRTTRHVVARTPAAGGSGDSAPMTALGVFEAMRAAAGRTWGASTLDGRTVGVEGLGKVGRHLVALLVEDGARVLAADVDPQACARVLGDVPDVTIVDRVVDADLDVYAPCAMGATVSAATVPGLTARIVCGAANNQLAAPQVEDELARRGVLWVPDFVANSGGLIQVAGERDSSTADDVRRRVLAVRGTVGDILELADEHAETPGRAAVRVAQARLDAARAHGGRGAA